MKRIFIIVEGQTEERFVKEVMIPFLADRRVYSVTPFIIHTNGRHYKGGFVNYDHLRNDIVRTLKTEGNDIFVTTFVDFFRIPTSTPGYDEIVGHGSHAEQAEKLQGKIDDDIDDNRFSSYIQLHEFEALLFSSNRGFSKWMSQQDAEQTDAIIHKFDSPEDINTTPEGAPSKRLQRIDPYYDKVMQGNVIALEVGIEAMLKTCPRFKNWIDLLIEKGNS